MEYSEESAVKTIKRKQYFEQLTQEGDSVWPTK